LLQELDIYTVLERKLDNSVMRFQRLSEIALREVRTILLSEVAVVRTCSSSSLFPLLEVCVVGIVCSRLVGRIVDGIVMGDCLYMGRYLLWRSHRWSPVR
jgi:hypothetical protein